MIVIFRELSISYRISYLTKLYVIWKNYKPYSCILKYYIDYSMSFKYLILLFAQSKYNIDHYNYYSMSS